MERRYRFFLIPFFMLSAISLGLLTGCPGNNSPASPFNPPAPTATLTVTNTPCMVGGTPCTSTFTSTATFTATSSPTSTPTGTPTLTDTATPTKTPTVTATFTPTGTPTVTPTMTNSLTSTPTSCPWSPSMPNTSIPTSTPMILPAGNFFLGGVEHYKYLGPSYTLETYCVTLFLAVDQVAVTNAAITLFGPSGNWPVTFDIVVGFQGGAQMAHYANYSLSTFTPGQSCTFIVSSTAGASTVIGTLPGGISQAADGSSTSWTVPGNSDSVLVEDAFNNITFLDGPPSPEAVSPVSIPGSAYPHCGSYTVQTMALNQVPPFNAAVGSSWGLEDLYVDATIYK